jgi:hypothetical protein
MSNKRTIKALEELVKTEYMAVAALDNALEEVEDNKMRRQYRKWRDSHMKQADALNDRLEDLGGEHVDYEVGSGKLQASLWGKLTGGRDDMSVAGMRIGAERGIKRYIDYLDDIEDPKTLNVIRKNLEAKQDEIEWYDDQLSKERTERVETKLEVSKDKAEVAAELQDEGRDGKKKGGLPFPLLIAAGAIGAASYFLLRRSDDADYDDYAEDAFRYETDESNAATSGSTTAGSMDGGSANGNM